MGGVGTGSSFINNYEALRKVRLNLSALHSITDPALEVEMCIRDSHLSNGVGQRAGE